MPLEPPRPTLVITGAAGFVGSAVVREAARAAFPVLAVSRRGSTATAVGVTAICVEDYAALRPPSDSVLIHLAEPRDIHAADTAGSGHEAATVGLLRSLLAWPWRFVVYASSVAVYGDTTKRPRYPSEPVLPQTAYGRAKLACESLVASRHGAVARLANLYGPGMAHNCVLADILAQIPGSGPLLVQTGDSVRDYLWVADAAAALVAIAARQAPGVFNVGSGQSVSVRGLAETALRIAGEADRAIMARRTASSASEIRLDVSDTISRTGWEPKVSLEAGILTLIESRLGA